MNAEELQAEPAAEPSDFWFGFLNGFGACFALACLAAAAVARWST